MGRDLKAENLSVSVPNRGCDKNCPYCISRMTGYVKNDYSRMVRNTEKIKNVARAAEVTSVLFTGKGEPVLAWEELMALGREFAGWPLELQTNGIILAGDDGSMIASLYAAGFDVIAVSMDSDHQFSEYAPLFSRIVDAGMTLRITVNITDILTPRSFPELLAYCREHAVHQLTLRKIVVPENPGDEKTARWIEEHGTPNVYDDLMHQGIALAKNQGKLIRSLAHGVFVYDIDGVSFSYSDYCIQERNEGDNIRSLVFLEDGHLYTSWNSRASILF
ncbi:MAG: radical SAM protein [Deltaproteobacteria bacterium]|nr:radical SAM protein [Candidatus Zymogenaceae bacterium]